MSRVEGITLLIELPTVEAVDFVDPLPKGRSFWAESGTNSFADRILQPRPQSSGRSRVLARLIARASPTCCAKMFTSTVIFPEILVQPSCNPFFPIDPFVPPYRTCCTIPERAALDEKFIDGYNPPASGKNWRVRRKPDKFIRERR